MGRVTKNQANGDQAVRQSILKLLDDTRRRLVETGTRNRLVHVNRSNTRGNVLNIVNERSNDVYELLSSGNTLNFLALGTDREEKVGEISFAASPGTGFDEQRYTDGHLETRLGPDALQKKLLKIAREAQTAEEESGVNMLYLAMGFLSWYEDESSSVIREAPLVLLPVGLIRNRKTSSYDVHLRDEDVLTNLPLQQRLREDFGIDLPELEIGDDWTPSQYFDQVAVATAVQPRWKIDVDAIQLGFFSFNKLLMYRDLELDAWANDALADNPLAKGLLYEGFEHEEPLFQASDRLDEVLAPEIMFHVVDADASQAKVIEEVRSGRNVVVQGPPGTGKSQTITNIIATAVMEGKRVLFLAEKMAALSVVHDRLVKVGLRDVCLELHSKSANKKAVLNELARTLANGRAIPAPPGAPTSLRQRRDRLNELSSLVHLPVGDTGETVYSVLGLQAYYMGVGHPAPSLNCPDLCSISRDAELRLLNTISEYGLALQVDGDLSNNPFEGTGNLDLQPVDISRLTRILSKADSDVRALATVIKGTSEALGAENHSTLASVSPLLAALKQLASMPATVVHIGKGVLGASDIPRLLESLEKGAAWRTAHDQASELFVDSFYSVSTAHLRGPIAAGTFSLFARWGSSYRAASSELAGLLKQPIPRKASERLSLIDTLSHVISLKSAWVSEQDYCQQILKNAWKDNRTDFADLAKATRWCLQWTKLSFPCDIDKAFTLPSAQQNLTEMIQVLDRAQSTARASLNQVLSLLNFDVQTFGTAEIGLIELDVLALRLDSMARNPHLYTSWAKQARLKRVLQDSGLSDLQQRMHKHEFDQSTATAELRFARAEALWTKARAEDPQLNDLANERRHDLVSDFIALEGQFIKDNVTRILSKHLAQLPNGATGEMGIIRSEIAKKKRHLALRKLFEKAGTAIQRVKPVLLMSPISVAQFLSPGTVDFDLLVIDEASQVRPEDALGAIARAKQLVVVGDDKQLPPSSFFDRLLADEEDADEENDDSGPDLLNGAASVGSVESILTLCQARGLAPRMLTWHYRSRDPSLITVSNIEFYDGSLVLPPSPLQRDPAYGLRFTRVDGVYDRGGKRDNRKEAEAVVSRVIEHARLHPTLSLGIVTFSFAQRNLITELLELSRRQNQLLDEFLREGHCEDVFVKNIENVQGDERDVILISVGYGPAIPGGRLASMSFGPVNGDGGERRLNVLFTRARIRCEVFASFDPGDIDLSRTGAMGPRVLKRFLDYARSGRSDQPVPNGLGADSPFEEDVAQVIRSLGFLADLQVGSAGFRIDIGVRHSDKPGTYILAVECDGASYHSALWARERDRLRQEVLVYLGWKFHRVWSTDWFYNRRAEIERLRTALIEAQDRAKAGIRVDGSNAESRHEMSDAEPDVISLAIPEVVERQIPTYKRAVFPVESKLEPHEVTPSILAELVTKIVEAEGPIHVEEVSRRVATCFRREKAGSRILTATRRALTYSRKKNPRLQNDQDFWFTAEQADSPPVRDRAAESGSTLKAANISLSEIKAAFKMARADNGGGDEAELIRAVARLLGFRRVGPELQDRLRLGMEE